MTHERMAEGSVEGNGGALRAGWDGAVRRAVITQRRLFASLAHHGRVGPPRRRAWRAGRGGPPHLPAADGSVRIARLP
jgi:hypothetical protein